MQNQSSPIPGMRTRRIGALLARGLNRTLGLHLHYVNVRRLQPAEDLPVERDGFVFDRLTREALHRYARDPELGLTPDFIDRALDQGDYCNGVLHHGRLVAYGWRSFYGAPHTATVAVRVRAPSRYGYKAFTRPDYRGLGLWPVLATLGDNPAIAAGRNFAVSFTTLTNLASIQADQKMGNRVVGIAGHMKLWGRERVFHSSRVKAHGFEFVVVDPQAAPASTPAPGGLAAASGPAPAAAPAAAPKAGPRAGGGA